MMQSDVEYEQSRMTKKQARIKKCLCAKVYNWDYKEILDVFK